LQRRPNCTLNICGTTTAAAVSSTDDDVNEVSEAIDGTVSERATEARYIRGQRHNRATSGETVPENDMLMSSNQLLLPHLGCQTRNWSGRRS